MSVILNIVRLFLSQGNLISRFLSLKFPLIYAILTYLHIIYLFLSQGNLISRFLSLKFPLIYAILTYLHIIYCSKEGKIIFGFKVRFERKVGG